MTDVVVDSCVATKWFVAESDSEKAFTLLEPEFDLIAPDIVLAEIANALWKNARLKRVSADVPVRGLLDAPRYFTALQPTAALLEDATRLAQAIDHPVYDCIYVVAARRAGAPLVTSDSRLVAKVAGTSDKERVTLLEHWKP